VEDEKKAIGRSSQRKMNDCGIGEEPCRGYPPRRGQPLRTGRMDRVAGDGGRRYGVLQIARGKTQENELKKNN